MTTTPTSIFHLIEKEVWEASPKALPYAPTSLEQEGFIHFSTRTQLPTTLSRYYADNDAILALEVPVTNLPAGALRWEESHPGESFPHLYCPLIWAWVTKVHNARTL